MELNPHSGVLWKKKVRFFAKIPIFFSCYLYSCVHSRVHLHKLKTNHHEEIIMDWVWKNYDFCFNYWRISLDFVSKFSLLRFFLMKLSVCKIERKIFAILITKSRIPHSARENMQPTPTSILPLFSFLEQFL